MKTEDAIKIGDIVAVNFNQAQSTLCHRAEVLYVPLAPPAEDAWVFKEVPSGIIHYVSEPCTISKHPQ